MIIKVPGNHICLPDSDDCIYSPCSASELQADETHFKMCPALHTVVPALHTVVPPSLPKLELLPTEDYLQILQFKWQCYSSAVVCL